MKEKIRQNNAKEPLDDPDYIAEKIKYEAIVDERNKKLERDQQLIEEYSKKLDEISLAVDSLNLWVDKTASENNINIELFNKEKEKLK